MTETARVWVVFGLPGCRSGSVAALLHRRMLPQSVFINWQGDLDWDQDLDLNLDSSWPVLARRIGCRVATCLAPGRDIVVSFPGLSNNERQAFEHGLRLPVAPHPVAVETRWIFCNTVFPAGDVGRRLEEPSAHHSVVVLRGGQDIQQQIRTLEQLVQEVRR